MPMEITIKLLENAMRRELEKERTEDGWGSGKGRFLIDGFPRKMDQALKFDEDVRMPRFMMLTGFAISSHDIPRFANLL